MSDILEMVISGVLSLVNGYFIFKVMNSLLNVSSHHKAVLFIVSALFGLASNTIIFSQELTGTIGILILYLLIIFIFYRGSIIAKIASLMVLYPLTVSISFLTWDIGYSLWNYVFNSTSSSLINNMLSYSMAILKVILWGLLYVLTKDWMTEISRTLTNKLWLCIGVLSASSCVGIVTVIYSVRDLHGYLIYPACISCILTCIGSFYICSFMSKSIITQNENELLHLQGHYYQEIEDNQNTVRKLRHDMKNHLNAILTLLHNNEGDRAADYIQSLDNELTTDVYLFCKNSIINAVLNKELQAAKENQIRCDFQIDIDNYTSVSDADLCTILANTLDNAIEAASAAEDKWVQARARVVNDHLAYEVKNSKKNKIIKKDEQFVTSKENKGIHGLGLKSVTSVVQKYNGTINAEYSDGTFSLTVLI